MNTDRAVELLKIYGTCPKCGETEIGEGKGNMRIGKNDFYRMCNCGFIVNVVEDDIE